MECDVLAFDGNAACQYGTSYASIMGEGRAEILEDTEEKERSSLHFHEISDGQRLCLSGQDGFCGSCNQNTCRRIYGKTAAAAACNAESDRIEEESEHEQMYMVSI